MNYYDFVVRAAQESDSIQSDTDFNVVIPAMIEYAEQRIYRDLNFLNTTITDTSVTCTANSRTVALPLSVSGSTTGFVTVTSINALSPVGTTSSNGTRNPLARSWQKMIDFLYPTNTSSGAGSIPSIYSVIGSTNPASNAGTIFFGPPPGAAFALEITGTVRPTQLSSTNTTTYLTQYFPDLFMAAAMIYATRQSSNATPDAVASRESQYVALAQTAITEQTRARYAEPLNTQRSGGL